MFHSQYENILIKYLICHATKVFVRKQNKTKQRNKIPKHKPMTRDLVLCLKIFMSLFITKKIL